MKDQITNCIANLQENIARLESTIRSNFWQKGYVANCKSTIDSHKEQISKLQIQLESI